MKSLFEKYKWLRIVLGIVLVAAGIVTIIVSFTNPNEVYKITSITLGICCFIYAALIIATSLIKHTRTPFPVELLIGAIFISIGVTLCIPDLFSYLTHYVIYLVSISLIVLGSVSLIKSIIIICYKDPVFNWLITLIFGLIALPGGIILLCLKQSEVIQIIYVVVGAMIVILGIFEIVLGFIEISKNKKKEN